MDRILRWRFYNGAEHYRNREAGVKSRADLRQPPLTGPTFLAANSKLSGASAGAHDAGEARRAVEQAFHTPWPKGGP